MKRLDSSAPTLSSAKAARVSLPLPWGEGWGEGEGSATPKRQAGMSLIEIMVAMFLLTIIMVGLFSAFYQSQRALKMSTSQTDVLEAGRSAGSLIARDLQEMTASGLGNVVNLAVVDVHSTLLPLPGGVLQTNRLQEFYCLTRQSDFWTGVGYLFRVQPEESLGTLFRFSMTSSNSQSLQLEPLFSVYTNAQPGMTNVGRVAEGVVQLTLRAFDTNGVEYAPGGVPSGNDVAVWDGGYILTNRVLPAWLELEVGVVDSTVYRQYKMLFDANPASGRNYLTNHAGKVYLFRQRIPTRNLNEP
jgi:prepilin-type N-terminal cleavage/methylation domain-containing protein